MTKSTSKELPKELPEDDFFYQLFESETSTYTYLIADLITREAAIIDPVLETVDRDLNLIQELGLKLKYILDTHIHADHITGAGELRKKTKAQSAVSEQAHVNCVDIPLKESDELYLGEKKIKVLSTPGHTNTCLSYYFQNRIFTGDSLMIRGCGRVDFQQGSSEKMYHSIHEKLFKLPPETKIFPGHDYRGYTYSTIELEMKFNPRVSLSVSLDEFKKIMSDLKLTQPKKIHEAVSANLACGIDNQKVDNRQRVFHPQLVDGIPEISCEDLWSHLSVINGNTSGHNDSIDNELSNGQESSKKIQLIDVRRPEEFVGELGHIKGAKLVTLGPELMEVLEKGDREQEIVFICRSGGRSGNATAESIRMGYKKTINMTGGMLCWNEKKFPTSKERT